MQIETLLNDFADLVASRLADRVSDSGSIRPRLLTVDQAASYLGRSKTSIQHLVSGNVLPTVRSDKRVFFDIRDLDAWIDQNKSLT